MTNEIKKNHTYSKKILQNKFNLLLDVATLPENPFQDIASPIIIIYIFVANFFLSWEWSVSSIANNNISKIY